MSPEKITIKDVPHIQKLINKYAQKAEMLPRSLNEIYENLRDYYVIKIKGTIIACGALHISWDDLAEIKSLAVEDHAQGKGYGKQIVEICLEEAQSLGIKQVFALSYKPEFFHKLGFKTVDKELLPRKIWGECVKCSKFTECDETCLVKNIF